jgi:CRP/FNR family transcriptional regulator, cyclic AMP receptor protein
MESEMESVMSGSQTLWLGYAASALVLATFCFSNPLWLRSFALLSNLAFIAFGYMESVYPVLLLHLLLMPINVVHLAKLVHPVGGSRQLPASQAPWRERRPGI